MYCLEALCLNATSLRSLDNLFFNALAKIFKTFDRNVLSQCLFYFNMLPLKINYYSRRVNFLIKLKKNENAVIKTWLAFNGNAELAEIYGPTGIVVDRSSSSIIDFLNYFSLRLP